MNPYPLLALNHFTLPVGCARSLRMRAGVGCDAPGGGTFSELRARILTRDLAPVIVGGVAGGRAVARELAGASAAVRLTGLGQVMAREAGDSRVRIGLLDGPVVVDHPLLAAPVIQVRPGECSFPC